MAPKKRTSKKTVKTTRVSSQTSIVRRSSVDGVLGFFRFDGLRRFFTVRKNLMMTLFVIILLGLAYLLRSVFIVAVVNGQPIYRWAVVHELEQQGGAQVLDSLVTEALVKQELRKAGVVVPQSEVDAQIQQIEANLTAQGLTLDQALAQEGLTKKDVEDDIRLQRGAEKLMSEKVIITDEEIDAYIADNAALLPENLMGEELRSSVRDQLSAVKMSEELQAWVQDLHTNSKVLYLKQYRMSL